MKPKIILYCLLGGLPLTIAAMGAGKFGWWWLSGIVLAAAFVPVALFGPRRGLGQFGVIATVLFFVTTLCTWTEAWVFVPSFRQQAVRDLIGSTVTYLIAAAVLATLAWAFKLTRQEGPEVNHRPVAISAVMVLVGGLAYAAYYLVFGAITYQYFTKGYYPEATQQVAQLGLWFWPMQIGRGVLMTLAVVPLIYTLRMPRWQAALAVGTIIWVAGGLSPLLVPNDFMGTTQRFIHIVEILTQNASLGITAVLLLRPRSVPTAGHVARVAAASL